MMVGAGVMGRARNLLQLDRAPGGDDGRRDQRDDMAGSGGDRAHGDHGTGTGGA
jgi:hypothetical protein